VHRTRRTIALLTAALALLAALPSLALADVEPNDGITQVEGPLVGGTTMTGTVPNASDSDWYVFYVASQTQLEVALTTPGDSGCDANMALLNTDGRSVDSRSVDPNTTGRILLTTPVGTTRYLVAIGRDDCGSSTSVASYQLNLAPAAAIVTGPGRSAPVPTAEPNEFADQAFGPLAAGTSYAGRFETSNDQDWFYFFTAGVTPFELALTNVNDGCPGMTLYLDADRDSSIDSRSPDANGIGRITLTPPGPRKYLIRMTGCLNADYQLRLEPPGALAGALPAPVPPPIPTSTGPTSACRSAQGAVRLWKARVRETKRKLRTARTAKRRRTLRRQLTKRNRQLTRARNRVAINC
jgi:hypothetical protein